jgi:hypothetical protein
MIRTRWLLIAVIPLVGSCSPSQPSKQAQPPPAPPAPAAPPVQTSAAPAPLILAKGEIQLEADGGTFVVPVLINDAITLKFTLDSGAADVSIPADVVSTLIRTGTIAQGDVLGSKTFVLADGSAVPSTEFRIRSLKVGNLALDNVVGSVGDAKGPLLLGQSFLGRLSSWSIDNQRHVLLVNATPAPTSDLQPTTVAAAEPADGVPGAAKPPLAASQSSSSPEAAAGLLATEIMKTWSSAEDPNGLSVRRFYAPVVKYYGTDTELAAVMVDKVKFANRWPERDYRIRPGSLAISCAQDGTCSVQGVVDWRAANPIKGTQSTGAAEFGYSFRNGLIAAETGRVLSRQ